MAIERSCKDQPKRGKSRLGVPAPSAGRQHQIGGRAETAVAGFAHRVRRGAGMNVERNVELRGDLEDRTEALVVKVVRAGSREEHRANELQLAQAAAQFLSSRGWIGRRQRCKRRKAIGSALHRVGKKV